MKKPKTKENFLQFGIRDFNIFDKIHLCEEFHSYVVSCWRHHNAQTANSIKKRLND